MPVQAQVQTMIASKVESTFGVAPTATGAQLIRRVSSSLNFVQGSFASNEVRSDQQVSDMRHGSHSVTGSIDGELSTQTYDEYFEAALRGTWTAGVSAAAAQFATGVTIADTTVNGAPCSTLTFAGAGNLLTLGFKIGDIVRGTGLTTPANNARNLRIVALTNLVMTVFPRLAATAQQAAGWTISVAGRKLLMGTTRRSFTIEQMMPDAPLFERYLDCRVGGFTLNVNPDAMATVSFDFQGRDYLSGGTQYFTSPTAEPNTGILSGVDGALRLNGEEQAVVTGLQLNFSNNLNTQPVIGSNLVPDIFYGRMVVTGSVSAYIEDADLVNAFLNESEVDLVAVLTASGVAPQDFLSFNMQRIKFSGAQKTIGPDGGVIAQFPFQALLRSGGSGQATDLTTLAIQRSNT